MASTHKALLLESKGAPLALKATPTPKPGKGQMLVKTHAAALNPIDAYQAAIGLFIETYPFICGFDGAGVVEAIGEGVTNFAVGDRVLWYADIAPSVMHTFQEYAITEETYTAKVPSNISFEEASTFPACLTTAAIGMYGELRKEHGGAGLTPPWEEGGRGKYQNDPFVVTSGSSCVGILAIQLAKMSGFNPIIASASTHNAEYVKAAGATHVIDYKATPYGPAFVRAVSAITSAPVKVVYDIAASPESQAMCWDILAPGGRQICAQPRPVKGDGFEDETGRKVIGVFASVYDDAVGGDTKLGRSLFAALEKMMADGDLKPCKVELLPGGLNGVVNGLSRLKDGQVSGRKLVAKISDTPGL